MRINRILDQAGPWGPTLLRIVVGFAFFMHGQQKLRVNGIDGTEQFFGGLGVPLPGIAAFAVVAIEIVGGIALILGLWTRVVALLQAATALVAGYLVHLDNGFFASDGGVELTLLLAAAGFALALVGPGALAVDGLLGRERGSRAMLGASRA